MVDGVGIGSSIGFKLFSNEEYKRKIKKHGEGNTHWIKHAKQDFKNADLIAIENIGQSNLGFGDLTKENQDTTTFYIVHAIYGNNVVTTETTEISIAQLWPFIKDRVVLCRQKPYILNGDCYN